MSDMAKCIGNNGLTLCKLRDTCYRYLVAPDPNYQQWVGAAFDIRNRKCELYSYSTMKKQYDSPIVFGQRTSKKGDRGKNMRTGGQRRD